MELNRDVSIQDNSEGDNFCKLVEICRQSMHLLNNRLTTILANTQLTLLLLEDEKLKHYLESVEKATREAGSIVRSFQESTHTISRSYSAIPDDNQESLIQK